MECPDTSKPMNTKPVTLPREKDRKKERKKNVECDSQIIIHGAKAQPLSPQIRIPPRTPLRILNFIFRRHLISFLMTIVFSIPPFS